MTQADAQIKAFLEEISQKRDSVNPFDRFEQHSVLSGGINLHLDVIEVDQNRPTIVFMPGTNAYAILYGEFLSALADNHYNIVGFDPRGHGRSGGRRGSYTLPELLEDMRAAVGYARNRFGDPIVASGSSQGGITAFYLAAQGCPIAGVVCPTYLKTNIIDRTPVSIPCGLLADAGKKEIETRMKAEGI